MGKSNHQTKEKVVKIITPVGTSLLKNLKDEYSDFYDNENISSLENEKSFYERYKRREKTLKEIITEIEEFFKSNKIPPSISAEISVIDKLEKLYFPNSEKGSETEKKDGSTSENSLNKETVKLEVHLFPSDSLEGYICAKAIEFYIQNREEWKGKIEVKYHKPIENLRIDSKEKFEKGIENLINKILEIAQTEKNFSFDNMIFNITGGYKAIIAYLVTVGQITQSRMYYLFEKKDEILELPLLPIGFDDKVVRLYLPLLQKFVINQLLNGNKEDKKLLSDLKKYYFIKEEGERIEITTFGRLLRHLENHFTGSFGYLMELILKEKMGKYRDKNELDIECDIEINVKKGINGDIDLLKKCDNLIEIWEIKSLGQITKFFAGDEKNPRPQYSKYLRFLKENGEGKIKRLVLFIYLLKTSKTTDLIEGALQNEKFDFKAIQQKIENEGIEFKIKYMEIPEKFLKENILIQNIEKLKIQPYNFKKE
ncbi:MAG: hypothetical protein ABGW77_00475 [Campylobacterales bacterium]